MLSMLMVTPPKQRSAAARQWRKIFPPPVSAYLDSVGNSPYIKILCEEHKKGIDWRMVAAHSLEASGRLLVPRGLSCPAETGLRRFVPTRFVRRMMENFALEVLINSEIPPAERSIAIYGSEAEIMQLLPRLVPLAGEICIISRRAYAINDVVEELIKKTGISITMTDEPEAGGCNMLLAPFGGAGFIHTNGQAVVISPDRPSAVCGAWVGSVQVKVPAILEEAYSEQYDPMEFVGAFYELAGMHALLRHSPEYGCCGDSRITAQELALLLR